MRIRAKKIGAIIISALLLTQLVPNMAWGAESTIIEINSPTTIDESISPNVKYEVPNGETLTIAANGNVQGQIDVFEQGTLIIENGGIVSGTINLKESVAQDPDNPASPGTVTIQSGGRVSGIINIYYGAVTVEKGGQVYILNISRYAPARSAQCDNLGTVNTVNLAGGDYNAIGKTGTLNLNAVANNGNAGVFLGSNSVTDTITYVSATDMNSPVSPVTIRAYTGARVNQTLDVYSDYLASNSSGTILVGNTEASASDCLLKLNGNSAFPPYLKFEVASEDTKINNDMSSSAGVCSVVCEGKTYPLPQKVFWNKALSELYQTTISANEVSLPDLDVGYSLTDATEETVTIRNTGTGNMKCKVTSIPEYVVVLHDNGSVLSTEDGGAAEKILSTGDIISLSSGASEVLTVRARGGNAAGIYNEDIGLEMITNVANDGTSDILINQEQISVSLTVNRKEGSGNIEVADIYYGETLNPVVTSDANGTENVTIEYKEKGAEDSSYTTVKPTQAGEYTARAIFGATEGYLATMATDDFSIKKKTGSGTIEVADIYCGGAIQPVVTSDANGIEDVTIEYKAKGADDSTYTTVKPTQAGSYTVRATFAENKEYLAATATDDFTITYLATPKRPYELQGTMGENHYYTSNVTIIPAEGYLISDSFDGEYKKELTVGQSSAGLMIYLQNMATGGITEGMAVTDFLIDQKAPVISNAVSGQTIYSDEAEIIVKDENLTQVLVNGEAVEIKNNQAILKLASNGGEEKYEIVTTDIAGNQSKIQITVAAEWMKKMIIPSGVKVRLSQECAYTLGSGTWKVSGDGTEYSGGNTFYVRSDGEYSFTKTN